MKEAQQRRWAKFEESPDPSSSCHAGTAKNQAPISEEGIKRCRGDKETLAVSESSEGPNRDCKEGRTPGPRPPPRSGTRKASEEEGWAGSETGGKQGDGQEDGNGSCRTATQPASQ
jgi:hypothetical protein